jgi:hypothetical protein
MLANRKTAKYNVELTVKVHEIPANELNRAIELISRLAEVVFRSFIFEVRLFLLWGEFTDNCDPRRFRDNQPIAIVPVPQFKNLADCECRKAFLETT